MPSLSRSQVWALGVAAVALLAVVLRVFLFHYGIWLYGETRVQLATLAAAILIGVATVLLYVQFAPTTSPDRLGSVVALLTIATVLYALLQGTLPNTPQQAAAGACRGVPVAGAKAYGQTVAGGINARTGAGTAYPQKDRFAGECTLGFDGYCIGEAIKDTKTGIIDQRWLIIHRRHELVSSAKVLTQSRESNFGSAPDTSCISRYGGLALPNAPSLTVTRDKKTAAIHLSATAPGALIIGFALHIVSPTIRHDYPFRVLPATKAAAFTTDWNPPATASDLVNGTGTVHIGAATCIAADVYASTSTTYVGQFVKGRLISIKPASKLHDADIIARQACAGPP